MLNRSIAPDFQPIKTLALIEPTVYNFDNGMRSFVFYSDDIQLIKLEFVFSNLYDKDENAVINTVMTAMMKEGTSTLSSAQIANEIDFYGAYLVPEFSFDHTALTVYTMRKYVDKILPIVADILQHSLFPDEELKTTIRNNKQALQISLQKNDVLARRMFYQRLFGKNRYGVVPTGEIYDSISTEMLRALFKKQIQPNNCTLFAGGNIDSTVLDAIEKHFSTNWSSPGYIDTDVYKDLAQSVSHNDLIFERKEDSLQSAIRMGMLTLNRHHEDFPAVQFVNTLLGGFFGSRLMRNIREDKGYTYSIGSAVANLKHTGFFTLATEVGVDVTKSTLDEIQLEFDRLRQDRTSEEEVGLVRNYLQGVMLGSLESIFSHMDKFKAVYFSGLDLSYYTNYSQIIEGMTPSKVQDIAIRYFDYDRLTKVVVGKM